MFSADLATISSGRRLRTLAGSRTLLVLLAVAVIWQLLSLRYPRYLFPGFQVLIPELGETLARRISYYHLGISLARILVSFVFSVVVGVALGLVMSLNRRAEDYMLPVVRLIMGVPALSWILVAVLWFRQLEMRVFFFIVIIALPIMTLNTLDGVKSIPKDLYDMLLSFRPTLWQRLRIAILPASAPYVLVGMKVGLAFTTRLVVFAELIGTTRGIGARMWMDFQIFNAPGIFVWTGILVALQYVLSGSLTLLERRLLRWRPEAIKARS